jgi:AcrR family transcriptional regulator
MTERRQYHSPLREGQAATTREAILRAFEELLLEGNEDVSMQAVATRAGVSVRTLYRHFENRDALALALGQARVFRGGDFQEHYANAEAYADGLRDRFERTAELAPLFEAVARAGMIRDRHEAQAPERRELINHAFADTMATLEHDDAVRLGAVLHVLGTAQTMRTMIDWWDLTPEQAARASGWAILALAAVARETGVVDHEPAASRPGEDDVGATGEGAT